jgi:exodeoxyribonuclease V gamma subunit
MLHLHRAERADGLVDDLAAVVRTPLADPFQAEVVAVPTRGVERWLAQRLSASAGASPERCDGVCANVDFPFPGRLTGGAVATASGIDDESDPWLPARSIWPLLEVVQESIDEPWLALLKRHIQGTEESPRRGRRLAAVRHVSDLYDRYALHRPDLLLRWVAGEDEGDDAAWQAGLWRRLRERIGVPSPAERLEPACRRLREEPSLVDLPPRLSLFGLTRLPASQLQVLRALAAGRDVHLFLLHPSAELWRRVAGELEGRPRIVRRADDPTALLPRSPLLASWGQDSRELQLVVDMAGDAQLHEHRLAPDGRGTLLAHLQADVRADREPRPAPGVGADGSVQVHACHGRARQVEVVRDAILQLLANDPTLEPRDIVVMCPDIESFAPLIHATFGSAASDDDDPLPPDLRPVDLRVRLADRSLRQTNAVLGVVAELLDLAGSRLTASQVLDLASRVPVRRRFRLDDDDLARVAQWASESGVRWGLDAAQRAPYRLERFDVNTWRSGWDRVLTGVAMAEEGQRLIGDVLPLDDVGSGDIDLAGRFAELLDRLHDAIGAFSEDRPLADWTSAIVDAADALTDTAPRDAWQRLQLARLLDDVAAESAGSETPLALPEVRSLLADRLRGRPTRASFRTGHLTMCTLVPMRSVPHRVVCLMGLDDGVFPRQTALDGDDLVLADPHVGDRDARHEDRQLLLDALLAATDHLVVTYTGRDERSNLALPPAVPVGELLDAIERTAPGAAREVVVEHPLQPFDARNFTAGALAPGQPWSFDRVALEGARSLAASRRPRPPFSGAPLPVERASVIELDSLVRFVQHPVRAFLRQRLGVAIGEWDDELDDALPVELDGLERWTVGDRLLAARLAGSSMDDCRRAERARNSLPPGALAEPVLDRLAPDVERLVTAAGAELPSGAGPSFADVRAELPDGRLVVGSVAGVRGDVVATATFSSVSPKYRLTAWVRLLALAATDPARRFEAVTIGRARRGARRGCTITVSRLRLADAGALPRLAALVDLHDRGLREALPLYCKTSAAYAEAVAADANARAAVEREWTTGYGSSFANEDGDPEHRLVLGGTATVDDLLDELPRDDERWAAGEPRRLGQYARRLWDDLLANEDLQDR